MARYIDSGVGDPSHSIGLWLEENLGGDILGFHAQMAFFKYGALEPFAKTIKAVAGAAKPVHLILGSNNGSLTRIDLERVLPLVQGTGDGKLVVVAYANAQFHPKTILISRADGTATAVVGSANLTDGGTARNVEAGVILESQDDGMSVIDDIREATDRWLGLDEDGVFPIDSMGEIEKLARGGVINVPQPPAPPTPEGVIRRGAKRIRVGRRKRFWSIAARPAPVAGVPAVGATVAIWAKKLPSSDAQQVTGSTNPTGKLRLAKARHSIDPKTFFRDDLFSAATWQAEVRSDGKTYEVALVDFEVTIGRRPLGTLTLKVDHALHRVAGQANVPTVLSWGSDLGKELRQHNHTDDWVVIERDARGRFSLKIQATKPPSSP